MDGESRSTRRNFLAGAAGAGLAIGAGSVAGFLPGTELSPAPASTGPAFDLRGMPYRQDDPRWGGDLMWDRKKVMRTATEVQGWPRSFAARLFRRFSDGNSIANEGCQLSCLAMILHLMAPGREPAWTPGRLNRAAHEYLYYTLSGLSVTALYADLVEDVTVGRVQLGAKEEYLSGVRPWPKIHPDTSPLVRAYRSLAPGERNGILVMLKTGTYDDTIASHYVLLQPNTDESPDRRDALILDPAMPLGRKGAWRLTDSARRIKADPGIARGWRREGIEPTQIAGAWAFTRWDRTEARSAMARLTEAWARELASGTSR